MRTFTKKSATNVSTSLFRKKVTTAAVRVHGPFEVETREGTLECPDGWLAFDTSGWPYPIAADEFEKLYEPVNGADGWRAPDLVSDGLAA